MTAKILLRLFVYSGLLLAVFSVIFFLMYTRPRRYVSPFTPADLGLAYETVEIRSFDGTPLAAWLIPHRTSKTAVLALHGYPMDKGNILSMVSFLAADHNILLPDLRAMGGSGGLLTSGGALEARDAEAAAAWLAGRGMEKIGLFGFSMGGNTALLAGHPLIAARVCDSPYFSLRAMLDIIFAGLGPFRRPLIWTMSVWYRLAFGAGLSATDARHAAGPGADPLLLIHGSSDRTIPPSHSEELKRTFPHAELWLVPGADHGQASGAAGREYEKRVAGFFRTNL
ncbi:MAG TPA: alpha/beta fold hydrolase [Elusimicrobiales bacterium]|nr:alpha/beta fold hydrolase [Elusimicrobiales bacterium]